MTEPIGYLVVCRFEILFSRSVILLYFLLLLSVPITLLLSKLLIEILMNYCSLIRNGRGL